MQQFALAHPWLTFFVLCSVINAVVLILRGYKD